MSQEPSKPEMTFGEAQGVTGLLACMDEVRTYRLRCWCRTEISGIRQVETARVAHKDGWRRSADGRAMCPEHAGMGTT